MAKIALQDLHDNSQEWWSLHKKDLHGTIDDYGDAFPGHEETTHQTHKQEKQTKIITSLWSQSQVWSPLLVQDHQLLERPA